MPHPPFSPWLHKLKKSMAKRVKIYGHIVKSDLVLSVSRSDNVKKSAVLFKKYADIFKNFTVIIFKKRTVLCRKCTVISKK